MAPAVAKAQPSSSNKSLPAMGSKSEPQTPPADAMLVVPQSVKKEPVTPKAPKDSEAAKAPEQQQKFKRKPASNESITAAASKKKQRLVQQKLNKHRMQQTLNKHQQQQGKSSRAGGHQRHHQQHHQPQLPLKQHPVQQRLTWHLPKERT